ncbi:MAG: hypothetical protein DSZ11_02275, partial [Sulfurovum sp.]
MKTVLLIIVILTTSLSWLLFHDKGNALLKPYLSSYLSHQVKKDINIQKLKIDMGHLEATAIIDEKSQLTTEGEFSLLTQTVELNYQLISKNFTSKELHLQGDIDVNGTAKGSIENMKIEGKGDAFKFDLAYNFILNKQKIHALKLTIDKAEVEKILTLMEQPSYAKGRADIVVHIPIVEKKISKGTVDIKLYETLLNENILHQAFDLTLPSNTKLTAKIHSQLNSNVLKLQGNIKSNLGTLSFKDANYSLKDKKLQSDYQIKTQEPTHHYPLAFNGQIEYHNKKLILKGESSSLGGVTQLLIEGHHLKTTFRDIHMEKLLQLIGEKSYIQGFINANVELSDIQTKKGRFTMKSKNLKTVNPLIKKAFDITLTEPLELKLEAEGDIDKELLSMKTKLLSKMFNLTSHKLQYHLKTASLEAPYSLNIPKLKAFKALVRQPLSGQIKIRGEIKKDKILRIKGITNSLGGELNFNVKDDDFRANLKSVSVRRVMKTLNYPESFTGKLFGDINYNLKNKKGNIHTQLKQAQLLPNEMTNIIKNLRGVDLTKERYNQSLLVAKIDNKKIYFDFHAKSKTTKISLNNAKLNQEKKTIHAQYTLVIENKDISGEIQGDIYHPKITIDSSKFVQKEIEDKMKEFGIREEDKQMINDTMKKIGIGKEEKEMIKNIFKG